MNPSQVRRRLFEETQKNADNTDNINLSAEHENREQGVSATTSCWCEYQPSSDRSPRAYQPSSRSPIQASGRETAERLSLHSSSDSSSLPGASQRDESYYTDVHMLICLHEVRGLMRQMDHNVARRIGGSQRTEDRRGEMINRNLGEGVAR